MTTLRESNAAHAPAILRFVEARSAVPVWITIVALVVALCWIDIETGWEMSFSIFYLIPVALGSWRGGPRAAVGLALLCAIAWYSADQIAGHVYSRTWIPYWNAIVRLGMFLTLGLTLAALKGALGRANQLARVDTLTGLANVRAFQELLRYHLDFATRTGDALTLAVVDLDRFKEVNDTHGHAIGDHALVTMAAVLTSGFRKVDIIARTGGDEFVVLMPRCGLEDATRVLENVRALVLEAMLRHGWPITASIGAATCRGRLDGSDLLKAADAVLYRVKAQGGNRVLAESVPVPALPGPPQAP